MSDADANIVDITAAAAVDCGPMPILLGEFEMLVILAVMHLGADAYAPALRREIERRARRPVARGAIYVTLDRLEAKQLLMSRLDDADAARTGRPRRYYRVSPKGARAVRRAVNAVERMRVGLEPLLNDV
jgi:DNA-binding PadR family transcriptional regulator